MQEHASLILFRFISLRHKAGDFYLTCWKIKEKERISKWITKRGMVWQKRRMQQ